MERQKEFRTAAVEAKRAGEIEQAKEYLKMYKGLDNLLKVAQGGLPVDLNTVCHDEFTINLRKNLSEKFSASNSAITTIKFRRFIHYREHRRHTRRRYW